MRITPLLIGLGLLCGTAAISSQVAGQGAATTGAAAKIDAASIGAAKAIENEVEGRLGNAVQKLAVGSDVFQNQLVRTGKASTAQLQFLDETNLSLSPLTQIKLDSFVYDPDRKTGKVVVNVPRGLVRFVTGSLEKRSYTIRTPFVAVGVRGTIFDMLVRSDRVTVLLVDGGVELTVQPRGSYVLDRPNTAITIWRDGRVIGPRDWTGSVTDFAALPPPPVQRRAAAPPGRQNATQSAAAPATGSRNSGASGGTSTVGSNSAINRLTGDGMGLAAASPPNLKVPDGNRPPVGRRSGAAAAGSSSGVSMVQSSGVSVPRQPTSSSGVSTVQSSGVSVPRKPTSSSGFDTVQSSGTSVPRSGSGGTLRATTTPKNLDVFRPPAQQPSCNFGNCPR